MSQAWNLERRQQILASFGTVMARLEVLTWLDDEGGAAGRSEIARLQDDLSSLWDAYAEAVPRLPIARCPFTGSVVHHSCDDAGLDGLWWRWQSPVRPEESLPRTFWALTGAVSIAPSPEPAPFLCKPGPGIPFVLPALLASPPVKAVVKSFQVGRHTAWAITYFVAVPGLVLPRPAAWGSAESRWTADDGRQRWDVPEDEMELDFRLGPWLQSGKLLWIAPGDENLVLRTGVQGCPYLDLEGEVRPQYVQFGEVRTW